LRSAQASRTDPLDIRKHRLRRIIEQGTPDIVEKCTQRLKRELEDIHRRSLETSTEFEERIPERGYFRPLPKAVIRGTGPSILRRAAAIHDAIAEARQLGATNLPESALARRLAEIEAALPAIQFEELGGRPLPDARPQDMALLKAAKR